MTNINPDIGKALQGNTIFKPKPYDPPPGHNNSCVTHNNNCIAHYNHNNYCVTHYNSCITHNNHNNNCVTHNNTCVIHNNTCVIYNDYTPPPPPPQTGTANLAGRVGNNSAQLKFQAAKDETITKGKIGSHLLELTETRDNKSTTLTGEIKNSANDNTDNVELSMDKKADRKIISGTIGDADVTLTLKNGQLTGKIGDMDVDIKITSNNISGTVKANLSNMGVNLTLQKEGNIDPTLSLIPILAYPKF
ncbi:MAG: hypothetical protein HYU63_06975 [Armatimonadetes bacterium]|nr:hypothetical protein [Armatimonadota bacterium]